MIQNNGAKKNDKRAINTRSPYHPPVLEQHQGWTTSIMQVSLPGGPGAQHDYDFWDFNLSIDQ